jgi:hypothetical protein
MYELTECRRASMSSSCPSRRHLVLYAYFEGTAQLADSGNHDRYTPPMGASPRSFASPNPFRSSPLRLSPLEGYLHRVIGPIV